MKAILFADALRRVTGIDLYQSAFLRETLYFPIYVFTPGLERHANFGDSWQAAGEELAWTAVWTMRLSSEYRDGYGQEFSSQIRGKYESEEGGYAWKESVGHFAILWYDESVPPRPLASLPLSRLFEGLGWVIIRSGWGSIDTYLAFKSGPNWNHAHADQNSFIFEAYGEPLIVDLGAGVYTEEYDNGPGIDYHQASAGHNVILFNGQGQIDPRSWLVKKPNTGNILTFQSFSGLESYEYIIGDASAAYAAPVKFVRQVVFVQHRFLVILDSVTASEASRFQWLAHTTGRFDTINDTFTVVKNGAVLTIKFLLPSAFDSIVYFDQNRQIDWSITETAPRLEVSNKDPATTATFLAVLYPTRSGESAPGISLTQNSTTWTVMVEDNETHYLYFSPSTPYPTFQAAISQTASLRATAPNLINMTESEILKAQQEGRTVGLDMARQKLDAAKTAYATSNYNNAVQLATQATQLARNATTPTPTTTSHTQTSNHTLSPFSTAVSPSPAILLGAIAGVGIAISLLVLKHKRGKRRRTQG